MAVEISDSNISTGVELVRTQHLAVIHFPTLRTPTLEFNRGIVVLFFEKKHNELLNHAKIITWIRKLLEGIEYLPDDEIIPTFAAKARLIGSKFEVPIINVRVLNLR